MNRFSKLLAVLTLLALTTSSVMAQRELQMGPPHIDPNGYDPDFTQPFIEPFTFDPDYQFFAPAGVDRLGGEIEPPIGWFATYDRTYLYTTRPEAEASETQGDYTWGNRFDLGYMTEESHGWLVSFFHLDGPSNYQVLEVERINVFQAADTINQAPGAVNLRAGGGGGGGAAAAVVRPGFPVRDRNDPVTLERDYRVQDSVNAATVSSFELNKTFRIDPLHYGSILEPFLGIRYTTIADYHRRDVYQRIDDTTGTVVYSTSPFGILPTPPVVDIADASVEQLISSTAQFRNHMFGGQLGLRWFKQKSRWDLSGEVRAFALQNFQSLNTATLIERTFYSSGTNGTVNGVMYSKTTDAGHASEFVFGTEIRAEAAYNVTKMLQLRGGVQFVDFARGIGRGNDLTANSQDFLMVGFTGGFTVNR